MNKRNKEEKQIRFIICVVMMEEKDRRPYTFWMNQMLQSNKKVTKKIEPHA